MAQVFGSGSFTYEHVEGWPHIPAEITLLECPGVGIDSQDNVFLLKLFPFSSMNSLTCFAKSSMETL